MSIFSLIDCYHPLSPSINPRRCQLIVLDQPDIKPLPNASTQNHKGNLSQALSSTNAKTQYQRVSRAGSAFRSSAPVRHSLIVGADIGNPTTGRLASGLRQLICPWQSERSLPTQQHGSWATGTSPSSRSTRLRPA